MSLSYTKNNLTYNPVCLELQGWSSEDSQIITNIHRQHEFLEIKKQLNMAYTKIT
jgi:hypothetical protein